MESVPSVKRFRVRVVAGRAHVKTVQRLGDELPRRTRGSGLDLRRSAGRIDSEHRSK